MTTTAKKESITFKADFGTSVTIPEDQLPVYVTTKADQVAALNRLIELRVCGCIINIDENDLVAFIQLAAELSHALSKTTMTATAAAMKGGAA